MPKKKSRADGLYEYKATIGRDVLGHPIRKSFYSSKSRLDAKRKAETYKQELENPSYTPASATFATWARRWLETYKRPFVTANTYKLTYEFPVYTERGDAFLTTKCELHVKSLSFLKKTTYPIS